MDYYKQLELEKSASPDDIKKAYRRLAMKHHPDHNQNASDQRFKEITEAYEVLKDPNKRAKYDAGQYKSPRKPSQNPIQCRSPLNFVINKDAEEEVDLWNPKPQKISKAEQAVIDNEKRAADERLKRHREWEAQNRRERAEEVRRIKAELAAEEARRKKGLKTKRNEEGWIDACIGQYL